MLLLYFFEVSTNVTLCIVNCYFFEYATVTSLQAEYYCYSMWRQKLLFSICCCNFAKLSICYCNFSTCYSNCLCTSNRLFGLAAIPGGHHREFVLSQMLFHHTNDWCTYTSTIFQLVFLLICSRNSSSDCVSAGSSRTQSVSTDVAVCLSCSRGEWQRGECAAETALA